jgi:streptogramin lyase
MLHKEVKMKRKVSSIRFTLIVMALTTLSCGLFSRAVGRDEPAAAPRQELIRQWASSAYASSEYDNPDWSAMQATGAPDTLECGDTPTAWASYDNFSVEWLEVRYETPVIPTEINIYESHTPTQVSRVEVVDMDGIYHEVYTAEPEMAPDCPYVLSVPVQDVDYQVVSVKITIDQSVIGLPWDEIDAVELVGYAEVSVAEQPPQPAGEAEPMGPSEPEQEPLTEATQPAESSGESTDSLPGTWTTYSMAEGLPNEGVHAIAVGNDGTVWIASGPFGKQSVSSFKDGAFTDYDLGVDNLPVTVEHHGLAIEPDGTVWVATGTRLAKFDGGSWGYFSKKEGLLDDVTKSVAIAPDGTLWLGTVKGVSHFAGGSWTHYTPDDGLVDTFIGAVAVDSSGNPWFVSSFDGVSYFDGGKWISYLKGDELPDALHLTAAIGPDGSVWIGSSGGGVSRFDGHEWKNYFITDEYDLEYLKAIVKDTDGAMWFATEGHGVYRFDGQNWMNFTKSDGLCYDYVDSLAAAPDGSIWFGCRKNGIAHFEP